MIITSVKIRKIFEEGNMKAVDSVTFDYALAVHDINLISSGDKMFVAMPSKKVETGYRDIVHPINAQLRSEIEKALIDKYMQIKNSGPEE